MISPKTRDLARRLLAYEGIAGKSPEPTVSAAVRLCEKLRQPVCVLAGVDGYRSLLARALTLARAEAPSLSTVQIAADGSLQHSDEADPPTGQDQTGEIFIAHLLGLLLTLLGATIALQLVQDVFPHLKVTAESDTSTAFESIVQEVQLLNNVSERLVSLADQHPLLEDALMSISGSIRDTATLLDVFVRIRSKPNELPIDTPQQPTKQYKM